MTNALETVKLYQSFRALIGDSPSALSVRSLDIALDAFFGLFVTIHDSDWKHDTRMRLYECMNVVSDDAQSDSERARSIGIALHDIVDQSVANGYDVPLATYRLAMHSAGRDGLNFVWVSANNSDTVVLKNVDTGVEHCRLCVSGDVKKDQATWSYGVRSKRPHGDKSGMHSLEEAKMHAYKTITAYAKDCPIMINMKTPAMVPVRAASIVTRVLRLLKPA